PLLLAVALSLTACGSRLNDAQRSAAAGGSIAGQGGQGFGDSTGGAQGTTGGTQGTTGGTQGTTGGTQGTTGGSGATGAVGSGGTTSDGSGPGSAGAPAPAPAGGNGGAVDVGVTADSLTLGNVSDLSGPVPGLFRGAVIGTQAYLAKVNKAGGVFGRQLKLKVGDGQLQCDENTRQHQALIPQVFAFVGAFSLYDGCGAKVLKANEGVPDVHSALAANALALPNNFSVAPLTPGWRTGPLLDYKKKYGDRFSAIGTIYADAGGGAATWASTKKAIESLGGKTLYERGFQPTETDFTADIVGMQRQGVKMIYVIASDAPSFARLVTAARQQSVDWPILAGGIAYDQGFISRAGAAAEGVYNDQQFAMFFNKDEAARVPAVQEFQTWTNTVAPGEKLDLFAVYGWSSAQLFVQALKAAGPKAKRADVLAELRKITSFDADGMLAPADPAGKKPPTCWLGAVVKSGKWTRVTPANGFRCDGSYYYNKG
ncbi:MAG: ABC transporter substrate-binding protein, partial [Mycobacteriales bacterium]